jgi:sporulation protein YlmC with PRC-barrel domain
MNLSRPASRQAESLLTRPGAVIVVNRQRRQLNLNWREQMEMMRNSRYWAAAIALSIPMIALAEDAAPSKEPGIQVHSKKIVQPTSIVVRGTELIGMSVKDADGRTIGSINDLMVDLGDNQVRYLAVSYGGFLGLGDKLFAVPVSAFDMNEKGETRFLVLDLPEERLKKAPGFDQNHWPNTADSKWQAEVNRYYDQNHKAPQ